MGKNRDYSLKLKLEAVKLYFEDGLSSYAIAKKLDVAYPSVVQNWMVKYKKYGKKAFDDKRGKSNNGVKGRPKKKFISVKEENEYLRAKLEFYEAIVNLDVKKK